MEETGRFLEVAAGQKQLPVSKSRFVGNLWVWEVARIGAVCIGPDWPYGVVISVLIACISGLYVSVVIPSIPDQIQWLSWLLPAALVLSYLFLFLSNPGIPLSLLRGHTSASNCDSCGAESLTGRQHCPVCGICINGYDHHCPFAGKCIGAGNKCVFVLFVCCFYAAVLGIVLWGIFIAKHREER